MEAMYEGRKDKFGNTFWGLVNYEDFVLKCTHDKHFDIVDFYINGVRIKQDDLLAVLFDVFGDTKSDIIDNFVSEKAYDDFLKAHGGTI